MICIISFNIIKEEFYPLSYYSHSSHILHFCFHLLHQCRERTYSPTGFLEAKLRVLIYSGLQGDDGDLMVPSISTDPKGTGEEGRAGNNLSKMFEGNQSNYDEIHG
jgi:hypothetical protein